MLNLRRGCKCLWLGCLSLASVTAGGLALAETEVLEEKKDHFDNRNLSDIDNGEPASPFPSLAGYSPKTRVVDHSRIDLDQADIVQSLSFNSFSDARIVYEDGGHSYSVATLTLDTPLPISMIARSAVLGQTESGQQIRASVLHDTPASVTTLDIFYSSDDEGEFPCQVGGAIAPMIDGCFKSDGFITIGGQVALSYNYDPMEDNYNMRSIQGFNTDASDIFITCERCPLETHQKFVSYYGDFSYADDFIQAALNAEATNLDNGNVDFANVDFDGRGEAIQRFTVYLNIWMFVVGMLESSIESCEQEALDSLTYWDQAVAFYTGSLEESGSGNLLYSLADEMCAQFESCDDDGTSPVNREMFEEFESGQSSLGRNDCQAAETSKNRIVALMTIPMIQGVFLHATKTDKSERDQAAGFVFASAVLPLIHDCNKADVRVIYEALNLSPSYAATPAIDLPKVKAALEKNYACLGITCADVGDLAGACRSEEPVTDKPGDKDVDGGENPDEGNGASWGTMLDPRWLPLALAILGPLSI